MKTKILTRKLKNGIQVTTKGNNNGWIGVEAARDGMESKAVSVYIGKVTWNEIRSYHRRACLEATAS